MAGLLADSVRLAVFSENMDMVQAPVSAILKQDKVLEVLIFDKDGGSLYERRRNNDGEQPNCAGTSGQANDRLFSEIRQNGTVSHYVSDDCLVFAAPVMADSAAGDESLYFDVESPESQGKDLLGFVIVSFQRRTLDRNLYQVLVKSLMLGALFILLAAIATYVIVRTATRPLNQLVKKVKKNDLRVDASDEIGLLQESFSSMVDQLSGSFATIDRLKRELEEMTREVLRTQEQERQRLAFDLHDNVAQELSGLKIFCAGLLKECSAASQPVTEKLNFISQSLNRCIGTVRELSYNLRPPGLTQLGLAHTVAQLCDEFGMTSGVGVDLLVTGFDHQEPEYNVAINCFRIIQEALSNVKKHAGANLVQVRLIESFPQIILRIRDDGVGFDVAARSAEIMGEKRMGLRNMEKRASLLNGVMVIESSPGKGTMIFVELPHEENQ